MAPWTRALPCSPAGPPQPTQHVACLLGTCCPLDMAAGISQIDLNDGNAWQDNMAAAAAFDFSDKPIGAGTAQAGPSL